MEDESPRAERGFMLDDAFAAAERNLCYNVTLCWETLDSSVLLQTKRSPSWQ
ncbi:uncharacterized protein V6R79_005114 [Siganus canaliculatus]